MYLVLSHGTWAKDRMLTLCESGVVEEHLSKSQLGVKTKILITINRTHCSKRKQ